ncbi:hypothetical protein AOLI_G00024300 [Acnodon oligacanthus]
MYSHSQVHPGAEGSLHVERDWGGKRPQQAPARSVFFGIGQQLCGTCVHLQFKGIKKKEGTQEPEADRHRVKIAIYYRQGVK